MGVLVPSQGFIMDIPLYPSFLLITVLIAVYSFSRRLASLATISQGWDFRGLRTR
jgi:hypothetical protein